MLAVQRGTEYCAGYLDEWVTKLTLFTRVKQERRNYLFTRRCLKGERSRLRQLWWMVKRYFLRIVLKSEESTFFPKYSHVWLCNFCFLGKDLLGDYFHGHKINSLLFIWVFKQSIIIRALVRKILFKLVLWCGHGISLKRNFVHPLVSIEIACSIANGVDWCWWSRPIDYLPATNEVLSTTTMPSYLCSTPTTTHRHRSYSAPRQLFACRFVYLSRLAFLVQQYGLRLWKGKSASHPRQAVPRRAQYKHRRDATIERRRWQQQQLNCRDCAVQPLRVIHGGAYLLCQRFLHCLTAYLSWIAEIGE